MSCSKWWIHYNGVEAGCQLISQNICCLTTNVHQHQIDRQIHFRIRDITPTRYQSFGIYVDSNAKPIQSQFIKSVNFPFLSTFINSM